MPKAVNKPIIAIDIDEVLAANAPSFVAYSNKNWGTGLKNEDYHEHWAELWKIDEDEMEKRVHKLMTSGVISKYSTIHGANEVIKLLSNNYELHVVTSRRKIIEEETMEWLSNNFPGSITKTHFAGIWDSVYEGRIKMNKTDKLQAIGAMYFIDDQPNHCFAAAKAGIASLLFGDYKWNYNLKLPKGVSWVKNWQEVAGYFKNEQSRQRV